MQTTRIATVKATGRRYIIQQIDFRAGKVHCWGEVVQTHERKGTRHEGAKAFILSAVDIQNDVPYDDALMAALFEQTKQVYAAELASGRKYVTERRTRR
jgi:hypothetical protein